MTFHIGQEVVCVDDRGVFNDDYFIAVKRGQIYIVAGFSPDGDGNLIIKGHPYMTWGYDGGWKRGRFRPIVKTDISIFQAMLAPSPKKRVDA